MNLIDKDVVLKHLDMCLAETDGQTPIVDATLRAIKCYIDDAPTVDAVKVVRCKDCKYDGSCMTQIFVEENSYIPFDKNTFYCADGERKDNGEEDEDAEK